MESPDPPRGARRSSGDRKVKSSVAPGSKVIVCYKRRWKNNPGVNVVALKDWEHLEPLPQPQRESKNGV